MTGLIYFASFDWKKLCLKGNEEKQEAANVSNVLCIHSQSLVLAACLVQVVQ